MYVHEECLKTWINSKRVSKETPHISSYYWSDIRCELCKAIYPDIIENPNGTTSKIIDYKIPESGEFIVLEGKIRNNKYSKIIYVLNLTPNDSIKLGRGHESNIRISDITVSRCHSIIKMIDK